MRLVLATSSSIALQPRPSSLFPFDVIFYWAQHEYVREREREREWERAEPGASYSALLAKTRLDVNEIGKTYKKKKMEFGYDGVCVCVAKKWRLVKQKIENVFAMQSVWATISLSCSKCFHSSAMDRQAGTERTILNAKNNLFSFSSGTTTTDSGKWRGGQKNDAENMNRQFLSQKSCEMFLLLTIHKRP